MRSYSDSHTPSHAHSQAHTTHPPTLPHMRYASWTPGPARQGEEGGALLGGVFVGGDEPGSSAESGHSFSMGPFTHTSDSVADSGRGTSEVSPSRVGGPESCDHFWFTSVHNYVWVLRFVVLLYCKISWFVNFGCPRWILADILVFLCNFKLFSEGDSSNNRRYVGMSQLFDVDVCFFCNM